MIVLKFKIQIFILTTFCFSASYSQDTSIITKPVKFGLTYNVNAGLVYGHSFGCLVLKNPKHQFELNILLLPGENQYKEKINFGSSLAYNFLPNKASNRFNLQFTSSLCYTNYQGSQEYSLWNGTKKSKYEYILNEITLFVGFGFNVKITEGIYISTSLSSYLMRYSDYQTKHTDYLNNKETTNTEKSFQYLDFEYFTSYDLLAKLGIIFFIK